MKYMLVLSLFLLIAACGSPQPETDPAINISAEDIAPGTASGVNIPNFNAPIDLTKQNVCRTNMQSAAAFIVMYQAQHSELPSVFEEALSCPEAGTYEYSVEGNSWTISCPAHPSHGSITDGTKSW